MHFCNCLPSRSQWVEIFSKEILLFLCTSVFITLKLFPRRKYELFRENADAHALESFQDFLIELDMKPRLHLVEMSIFSLNHVIVKPTKLIKEAST